MGHAFLFAFLSPIKGNNAVLLLFCCCHEGDFLKLDIILQLFVPWIRFHWGLFKWNLFTTMILGGDLFGGGGVFGGGVYLEVGCIWGFTIYSDCRKIWKYLYCLSLTFFENYSLLLHVLCTWHNISKHTMMWPNSIHLACTSKLVHHLVIFDVFTIFGFAVYFKERPISYLFWFFSILILNFI